MQKHGLIQAGVHPDIQTYRQAYSQTYRKSYLQTGRHTDHTYRHICSVYDIQTGRQTYRHAYIHTDRRTDTYRKYRPSYIQAGRHPYIHTHTERHTYRQSDIHHIHTD